METRRVRQVDMELPRDAFKPLPPPPPPGLSEITRSRQGYRDSQLAPPEKKPCYDNSLLLLLIGVPIIVWVVLLIVSPAFISDEENDNSVDYKLMLLWTGMISVVVLLVLFGLNRCNQCN